MIWSVGQFGNLRQSDRGGISDGAFRDWSCGEWKTGLGQLMGRGPPGLDFSGAIFDACTKCHDVDFDSPHLSQSISSAGYVLTFERGFVNVGREPLRKAIVLRIVIAIRWFVHGLADQFLQHRRDF